MEQTPKGLLQTTRTLMKDPLLRLSSPPSLVLGWRMTTASLPARYGFRGFAVSLSSMDDEIHLKVPWETIPTFARHLNPHRTTCARSIQLKRVPVSPKTRDSDYMEQIVALSHGFCTRASQASQQESLLTPQDY